MLALRTVNKLSIQKLLHIVTGLKQNCSHDIIPVSSARDRKIWPTVHPQHRSDLTTVSSIVTLIMHLTQIY